jgi:hypothetical protein
VLLCKSNPWPSGGFGKGRRTELQEQACQTRLRGDREVVEFLVDAFDSKSWHGLNAFLDDGGGNSDRGSEKERAFNRGQSKRQSQVTHAVTALQER